MSYSDFIRNWDYLEMVHLTIEAFSGEILNNQSVIFLMLSQKISIRYH
jgi:hypothetical protein